ncbi:hypothetical protein [Hahella sp. HN01]|uniref:hypothetical protein n=1 Tax=Hahella sp. HN01 TaxID=2847262 RepID=UPI001C1F0657|nr:hypothetical protein [Hahella sp. HN01]MBU6955295.1 hypothetical protein [Hahella sp. HN01]
MTHKTLGRIGVKKLVSLAEKEDSTEACDVCEKEKLKSWSDTVRDLSSSLDEVAEFENAEEDIKKNGYNEYHPNGTNYWSVDAPIAIHFYPYNDCSVNVCKKCSAVFLRYIEYAGHGRQHRIRYVDKNLIVG